MKTLKPNTRFSKSHLSVFAIVFAILGIILLIQSIAAPNPSLPGDLNNDNTVNVQDLSILLSNYNTTNSTADINGDGQVNVLDLSILLSNYGRSIATNNINAAASAHTIDGNLNESDWNLSGASSKCVFGTCNNSVTFGALWDKTYLYVGVKVIDSSLKNDGPNCWDDDGVEVYIDPTDAGGTTYTSQDRQIVQRWNDSNLCAGIGSSTGVLHAWAAISGGYSVELAIPWSNLGVTPSSGMNLGFDVGNNDDDDGGARDAQLMGFGTINNSQDPSGFGQFKLSGTPPSAPTASLSANPATINAGASSTLSWSSSNATSCSASWTASKATSGTQSVTPGGTTNYSISCTGTGGTANASATVTVNGGTSGMYVGINETGWGIGAVADIAGAVKSARVDTYYGEPISDYTSNGVTAMPVIAATCPTCGYSTSGVSSINANSWASSALSWYQSNCNVTACPTLEVLNEPEGWWFWGTSSGDGTDNQTNASAYANLLVTTYNLFHSQLGSNSPKIIGAYDNAKWGGEIYTANANIGNYVDGWVVHPYGGCGTSYSALGDRNLVTSTHTSTNKPIYVTEVGWPTAVGQNCTGDSNQWTEQQEADNIYNFVQWARSTGYVAAVLIYNYRDQSSGNALYGIEHFDGTKKPAYNALRCAALNQAENCP